MRAIYSPIHSFLLPFCIPEAEAFGTMLVAYGYIYPLQNHRKLIMCNDASLYRFQVKSYFFHTVEIGMSVTLYHYMDRIWNRILKKTMT